MNVFLILCLLIMTSAAAPVPNEDQAKILQYDNTNDGKGNYEFSFNTSNGIQRSESGILVNEGQPDEHIEVRGFYSYIDPDGKIVQINYTADENGYQIVTLVPVVVQGLPSAAVASLLG